MRLTGLYVYPIKSVKGISLDTSLIEDRGLQYDRRWMLVDSDNRFITQREHPRLATLTLKLTDQGMVALGDGQQDHLIPYEPSGSWTAVVQIWKDTCEATEVNSETSEWFSGFLNSDCRLVYMPDSAKRLINPQFALTVNDVVSFADAHPFMLLTEASLSDLNSRLSVAVPMNRFRPNFVVNDAEPFAEDAWKSIAIGDCDFYVAKGCARCVMTTVDQEAGRRDGDEPLKTLTAYRRTDGGVLFGRNLIAMKKGIVRVGDEVVVKS